MKRQITAILAALMLFTALTACGKTSGVEPSPDVVETPAPTPTPTPITNPLTGQILSEDYSEIRPYAIMINNISVAQPQVGISNADIIYEVLAEGGVTRMMAIFHSVDGVEKIGSMRSLRPYYLSIALSYDAITVHAGGSEQAYSDVKTLGADNIDGVRGSSAEGTYFRDKSRQQYGIEHSLFATGSGILETTGQKSFRTEHEGGYDTSYGLLFSDDAASQTQTKAEYVKVIYNSGKNTSFVYNDDTKLYEAYQYGSRYTDDNKTNMSFTNLLILSADTKTLDSYGRLSVDLVGSGEGYFNCGGKYVPIRWERADTDSSFSYYLEDGTPLELGVGKTFISVMPTNGDYGSSVQFKEEYEG